MKILKNAGFPSIVDLGNTIHLPFDSYKIETHSVCLYAHSVTGLAVLAAVFYEEEAKQLTKLLQADEQPIQHDEYAQAAAKVTQENEKAAAERAQVRYLRAKQASTEVSAEEKQAIVKAGSAVIERIWKGV